MKKYRPTKKTKKRIAPFPLRLPEELMKWVYEEAKEKGISRNQEICNLVEFAKKTTSPTTIIKGKNHV